MLYRTLSTILWAIHSEDWKGKKSNKGMPLSQYMGAGNRSFFPDQLKFQVTLIAHHFWRLKNCVMKVRIRKKMLPLEETQRNFARDASDFVDNQTQWERSIYARNNSLPSGKIWRNELVKGIFLLWGQLRVSTMPQHFEIISVKNPKLLKYYFYPMLSAQE